MTKICVVVDLESRVMELRIRLENSRGRFAQQGDGSEDGERDY